MCFCFPYFWYAEIYRIHDIQAWQIQHSFWFLFIDIQKSFFRRVHECFQQKCQWNVILALIQFITFYNTAYNRNCSKIKTCRKSQGLVFITNFPCLFFVNFLHVLWRYIYTWYILKYKHIFMNSIRLIYTCCYDLESTLHTAMTK